MYALTEPAHACPYLPIPVHTCHKMANLGLLDGYATRKPLPLEMGGRTRNGMSDGNGMGPLGLGGIQVDGYIKQHGPPGASGSKRSKGASITCF